MDMEKITSIRKLRRFAKREGKDFSYKDLSGLDLSKIEPEFWEGARFYYTNLSNTGIKFKPRKLAEESIEGCNLEGVDLSDSTDQDWLFIDIKNTNLRDTGLRISLHYRSGDLGTVLLDENFGDLDPEEFDGVNLSFEMLEINPFIKITPQKLSEMIEKEIHDISVFITESKATTLLKKCEERLEEYDDGTLTSLYTRMCEGWSTMDKLSFFNQSIIGKKFEKLDLSGIPVEVIGEFIFKKCMFGEIIFDNSLNHLTDITIFNRQNENEFETEDSYINKKDYESYYKVAELLNQLDKKDEATEMLFNLLDKKPDMYKATELLGDILISKEMYKEAVNIYQEALKYNPVSYEIHYNLGIAYTMLNDFQNAKICYEKAANINSLLYNAKYSLAEIALIYKDLEEAEKRFLQAIEEEELSADAYYELAKIYLIKGDKETAINYANTAIDIDARRIVDKIRKEIKKEQRIRFK